MNECLKKYIKRSILTKLKLNLLGQSLEISIKFVYYFRQLLLSFLGTSNNCEKEKIQIYKKINHIIEIFEDKTNICITLFLILKNVETILLFSNLYIQPVP